MRKDCVLRIANKQYSLLYIKTPDDKTMLRKTLDQLPNSRPYLLATAIAVVIFFPTWNRLAKVWLEFEQVLAHGLATAVIFIGLVLIHQTNQLA